MPDPIDLAPGAVFARDFRVVRPLSRGGMGSVYVVEQVSTGRQRALKLMHADLAQSEGLRRRFEQEARVGARIESEHVVEVLAAGVDDASGMPWLVMELLEGEDLAAALARRGPLPLAEVARILSELCHALGAAHAAGVVHRDLKPENVFLASSRRASGTFTVKVLDFGIAKVLADAHTAATGAVGTPLYMAPEQTSAGGAVTPAADVWALGLVAFRMLSGRAYWKGGNTEPSSPMVVLREVVIDAIVRASERAREVGSSTPLPAGFDEWFARCVARDPTARFANAIEAFAGFAALAGVPPLSREPGARGATVDAGASPFEPTLAAPGATPSPLVSTDEGRGETLGSRESSGLRRGLWIGAPVAAVGAIVAVVVLRSGASPATPPSPGVAPQSSAVAEPLVTPPPPRAEAAASAPGEARGPLVHICEKSRSDAGQAERCSEPSRAWCDRDERFVACCGKGLVPGGSGGACVCPPGGAIDPDPIAAGCQKAEGERGLRKEVVQSVVRAAFPDLRRCYERSLEKNQVLRGKVELWLEVTPWGDVFAARIRSSTLPDPDAQSCALDVARGFRFPPLVGGGVLTLAYPVQFSPG